MFKFLVERLPSSVAGNFVKDLGSHPPSKSILSILGKILMKMKLKGGDKKKDGEKTKTEEKSRTEESYQSFKANVVRTLNIMLARTAKEDFNLAFQISFPLFLKENLSNEAN